jgi:hypothetical protein
VKANVDQHASSCFSCTEIFSSLLVTGVCTYPELTPLTALPLWACDGIVGGLLAAGGIGLLVLGKQKLVQLHLVPQDTVKTMKENVQWLTEQVRPNSRATRDRQR